MRLIFLTKPGKKEGSMRLIFPHKPGRKEGSLRLIPLLTQDLTYIPREAREASQNPGYASLCV